MLLGVHVPVKGGICNVFPQAEILGCNTIQIFSRSPQRWRQKVLNPRDIETFNRLSEKSDIRPIFIHIPYLINLASPEEKLYEASIQAYIEDIFETDALGAEYIVTHMGSHKKTSEGAGLDRLIKAINIIFEKTKHTKINMLLENTAGSGSWLGYKFIHQKNVIEGLKYKQRAGLCLDTAHAYSAGYNIADKFGLEDMLDEIDSLVNCELIKLIHFNDTKDKLGSHRDRHEHIGKGSIGLEGMKRILNHPKLRNKAFILETPKDSENADKVNLDVVRSLRR